MEFIVLLAWYGKLPLRGRASHVRERKKEKKRVLGCVSVPTVVAIENSPLHAAHIRYSPVSSNLFDSTTGNQSSYICSPLSSL